MQSKETRESNLVQQKSFLDKSLLWKTLFISGSVSIIVATLFIFLTLEITQKRIEEQSQARLNELIDSMSAMASIACFANDATLASETLQAFIKNRDVQRITIRSKSKDLAHVTRHENTPPNDPAFMLASLKRELYSPFVSTEIIGEIEVTPNWQSIRGEISKNVQYTAVILILFVLMIVGVIAAVITFFLIHPVKSISDRIRWMLLQTTCFRSLPDMPKTNWEGWQETSMSLLNASETPCK